MSKVPTELLALAAVATAVLPITVLPAGARTIHEDEWVQHVAESTDYGNSIPDVGADGRYRPFHDSLTEHELLCLEDLFAERKQQEAVAAAAFYHEYYAEAHFDERTDDNGGWLEVYPADPLNPVPEPKKVNLHDDWEHEDKEEHYRTHHLPWGDADAAHFNGRPYQPKIGRLV